MPVSNIVHLTFLLIYLSAAWGVGQYITDMSRKSHLDASVGATMKMRGFGSRQDSKVSQFLPDFMIAPKGFERGPEPPKVAVIV